MRKLSSVRNVRRDFRSSLISRMPLTSSPVLLSMVSHITYPSYQRKCPINLSLKFFLSQRWFRAYREDEASHQGAVRSLPKAIGRDYYRTPGSLIMRNQHLCSQYVTFPQTNRIDFCRNPDNTKSSWRTLFVNCAYRLKILKCERFPQLLLHSPMRSNVNSEKLPSPRRRARKSQHCRVTKRLLVVLIQLLMITLTISMTLCNFLHCTPHTLFLNNHKSTL